MKDSEARQHYLSIRAERQQPKRPLGFEVAQPKSSDFYRQPYGLPNSHFEEAQ